MQDGLCNRKIVLHYLIQYIYNIVQFQRDIRDDASIRPRQQIRNEGKGITP